MASSPSPGDPTRAELLAFLEREHASVSDETTHTEAEAEADDHDGCGCRFDIEEAAWNLAAHWHGGQSSNLYAALSASDYDPGCADDLPDDLEDEDCERMVSTMLYLAGDDWIRAGCPPRPGSGYTPCACRDCMEIAISGDISAPDYCDACARVCGPEHTTSAECQAPVAYGGDDDTN